MFKKIVLTMLLVLISVTLVFSQEDFPLWEGFEEQILWTRASWENTGISTEKSTTYVSEGKYSLKFKFSSADVLKKAVCMLEQNLDWSEVETMKVDIYNDTDRFLMMTLSVTTGAGWEWYESKGIRLNTGWNKDITFNLKSNIYKAERSNWRYILRIQNLADVRRVCFNFWDAEGDVYIDNIRLKGYKKPIIQEVTKPADELQLWESFEAEETLWSKAGWETQAVSAEISKEFASDGKQSLKCEFINATELKKATFCIEEPYDWSRVAKLYLDVYNTLTVPVKINLAISTGEGWFKYETPDKLLGPQWNKSIVFDLNAKNFKCAATNWAYSSYLKRKEKVKRVAINVMGLSPEGATGAIYIDNIKQETGEPLVIPVEIKPEVKEVIDIKNYKTPQIKMITAPETCKQFDKFEITLNIESFYNNPYNPDEIDLIGSFTSPSGIEYKTFGFFYQNFIETERGTLKEKDKPIWKIRFAPNEPGKWQYKIQIKNPKGETISDAKYFVCAESNKNGFITTRRGSKILWFTNGKPYYAIGHNLCWTLKEDTWSYDDYLKKFYQTGQNWARIWNCPWGIILEWGEPRGEGLGRYSQKDAYKFDQIIELCEKYDIYIQMVINSHSFFIEEKHWEKNPYNFVEGGPCKKPNEFFTDKKSKEYFKRKLRYFIARWGYSTSILSWELFNEVDLVDGYNEQTVTEWHKEMSEYIKQIDTHKHLVTTSCSRRLAGDLLWKLPAIDYTQIHIYVDEIISATKTILELRKKYNKPCLIGETGGAVTNIAAESKDKKGIRLLDALWSPVMSYSAGTGMYWWWDGHIKVNNLYHQFHSISKFLNEVDFSIFDSLNSANIEIISSDKYADLIYAPPLDWEISTAEVFTIDTAGNISGGLLSRYLQSEWHKEMKVNPVFNVYYPSDGTFSVYVLKAAKLGANLKIFLDDELLLNKNFPAAKIDVDINKEYTIKVPKGKHEIKLVNNGEDWVKVSWMKFSNVVPQMYVAGIQNRNYAILWLKNRQHNLDNYFKNAILTPIRNSKIRISLNNGEYKIRFYDITQEIFLETETKTVTDNVLELTVPTFKESLACLIERQ